MATETDVVKVLRYMAAAWPRVEVLEQTVAVYVMHMLRTGLAADVLLLAAMNLVDSMEFFPSVAEWRRRRCVSRTSGRFGISRQITGCMGMSCRSGWRCRRGWRTWCWDMSRWSCWVEVWNEVEG